MPLVLGIIMLIYSRERKVYGGFKHWILANFGLFLGYTLVSLRDFVPAFLSIVAGNSLIVYCIILIYEGIEEFYDRPAYSRFNYGVFVAYILLQTYFTLSNPDLNARLSLSSLAICILLFHAGSRLYHTPIPQLQRTSRAAGFVFLVTTLFPLVRGIASGLAATPVDFFPDALSSWFSVIFIISIIIWTFYFFFLNSARLELDLETARAELDLIARTDPLTNLYNRRHFDEYAELELQRVKRSGHTNSVLLLDIDGFKSINDDNGHEVGDALLSSLSILLRSELRPFDLIARYGGDEFVILLTNTNRDQAYSIAERIRKRIGLTPFIFNSRIYNITLSAGISTYDFRDTDLKIILKRSDDALYRAKEQGRNRVMVAEANSI
jgi:diguanylate cyclase (GGDEF)-like protein